MHNSEHIIQNGARKPFILIQLRKLHCCLLSTAASRGSGLPAVFSPENQARLTEVAMAMQEKLADLVPGGEQVLVEGAGHNVHLDKPEAVLAPIRAMIARLRGQPTK